MLNLSRSFRIRIALLLVWLFIWLGRDSSWQLLQDFGGFALLGVIGALFANSTGAGGGVVFIPFFNQLGFSAETAVATSFAIQCCGMTAGALTWWHFYRSRHRACGDWAAMGPTLLLCVPFAMAGLVLTQWIGFAWLQMDIGAWLHKGFGVFSMLLALAIFASVPLLNRQHFAGELRQADVWGLTSLSFVGGMVNAWLSVGVGELVAVYLILRRFNVTFAIAVAVIISAFSVWSALIYHLLSTQAIAFDVVLFAGLGAVVGGSLARHLVLKFSACNLKLFFAGWIMLLGLSALIF